jgi:hypothetical protein
MKKDEIIEIVRLLKSVRKEPTDLESKESEGLLSQLQAVEFALPVSIEDTLPCIAVDGSYCFLFSFLGAETYIALFRIAILDYRISIKDEKIHYIQNKPPKYYDHLSLISFNPDILKHQYPIYREIADFSKRFQDRQASLFASNMLTYLEQNALKQISSEYSNCILLKDGALLSFKGIPKVSMLEEIIDNCKANGILFAGISKSTNMRSFNHALTDDYYLKRFYDKKYPNLTHIPISKDHFQKQTKYDVWGDVHLAKLHGSATKWFRVDVGSDIGDRDSLFSALAAYSQVHLLPGYPISLIEAHKLAKSVRDLKTTYELEIIDYLKEIGVSPAELIAGEVDVEGREYGSFHEILDQLSK